MKLKYIIQLFPSKFSLGLDKALRIFQVRKAEKQLCRHLHRL